MSAGAEVRHARTERKLSLAEVSEATKIQPWVLEALEADRLQELMSPIYVKGFVTTYAKFLHLDPVPLIAQLPWPKPEPKPEPLPPSQVSIPRALRWPPALRRRLGPAVALAAVLLGLMALHPLQRWPRLSMPSVSRSKLANISPIHEAPNVPELPTLALLASQPLELSVIAHRTLWIQVRADGKLLTQQRLARGAKEQWTAKKQFELIVSMPSQVDLLLNGQPISSFAIAHEGRLLITHHGITKLPVERR